MSLRTASLLAFVGALLLSVLDAFQFVRDVSATLQGIVPAVQLLSSTIRLFAVAVLTLFLYTYHSKQA